MCWACALHRLFAFDAAYIDPAIAASDPVLLDSLSFGGEISCPPNCAGMDVPASQLAGLFVYLPCDGFITGTPCLQSSIAHSCGYGAGGSACKACPNGALCPGGERTWPAPGTVGCLSFGPIEKILCFCDVSVREKDWRSRARGVQAT